MSATMPANVHYERVPGRGPSESDADFRARKASEWIRYGAPDCTPEAFSEVLHADADLRRRIAASAYSEDGLMDWVELVRRVRVYLDGMRDEGEP